MKIVFTTRPAMITLKKTMPRTSGTALRQWYTIQLTLRKMARPTRQTPSVMKKAMVLPRLVMRMAVSLVQTKGSMHWGCIHDAAKIKSRDRGRGFLTECPKVLVSRDCYFGLARSNGRNQDHAGSRSRNLLRGQGQLRE